MRSSFKTCASKSSACNRGESTPFRVRNSVLRCMPSRTVTRDFSGPGAFPKAKVVRLALRHFGARFFQNAALALGQALDAVSGNFIENGIHFFAKKFFGRQVLFRYLGA